jgi:hypothetical protein
MTYVESDVAKVVRLLDARRVLDGRVVAEPLHFHGGITNRDKAALEMSQGSFSYRFNVLQRSSEKGSLEGNWFKVDFFTVAGGVFKFVDLVQSLWML